MNERRREYSGLHPTIHTVTDRPHVAEWMIEGDSFYRFADANLYRVEYNNPHSQVTAHGIITPHPHFEAHVTTRGSQTLGSGLMRTLHTNLSEEASRQMPATINSDDFLAAAWAHFHMQEDGGDMPIGYYQEDARILRTDTYAVDTFLSDTRSRAVRLGFDPARSRFQQDPVWHEGEIIGASVGVCYARMHVGD